MSNVDGAGQGQYGPYHRIQDAQLNEAMQQEGRVSGKAPRNIFAGAWPKVKAYVGPLPSGQTGIEFSTHVQPDPNTPPGRACWSKGRPGVLDLAPDPRDGADRVAIPVSIARRVDHATR